MKIEDLPRPANYRRQMAKNGGYEMVPAYTAEEVLGIVAALDNITSGNSTCPDHIDGKHIFDEMGLCYGSTCTALDNPHNTLDAERLDWLEKNGGQHTVCVNGRWYVRDGYGWPHIRYENLRKAIDAAIKKGQA